MTVAGETLNEAAEAFEAAVNSSHLGTRIAFWTVMACASILVVLVLR